MRAVNLLPRDESRSRRALPGPWVLLSAAAPILAGSAVYLGYSMEHSSVLDKRAELQAVQSRVVALGSRGSNASRETGLVTERTLRQAALTDVLGKTMPWDIALDDLARVIPPDVWLTTLTAQSPTPAGVAVPAVAAAPSGTTTTTGSTASTPAAPAPTPAATPNPTAFTLAGYAHSQDAVAHLLARLQLLPMLSDVTLGSTTSTTSTDGTKLIQFQLTAAVSPVPAVAP